MFRNFLDARAQPNQTEAAVQVDFTGGLRIGAAGMELQPNEVRDCMNVDFPATGGVERRKAVWPLAATSERISTTTDIVEYRTSTGVYLYWSTEGANEKQLFVDGSDTLTTSAFVPPGNGKSFTGTQVGDKLYARTYNGPNGGWSLWDGTTTVAVRNKFREDDYEGTGLPNFSEFHLTGTPRGKRCLSWNSRLWVWGGEVELEDGAYVYDAALGKAVWTPDAGPTSSFYEDTSTLYFSFAYGQREDEGPQDFYANWALRFESDGVGEIVGLAALGERLFVFGDNKIHVVTPNFAEPVELFYKVQEYRSTIGLASRHALAASGNSVWFFDQEKGLMEINSEGGLVNHMEKIDGLMPLLLRDKSSVCLGLYDDRVWVSVPEILPGGSATPDGNTRTYVYDIKTGAWTRYNYGVDRFFFYRSHLENGEDRLFGWLHQHADNLDVENSIVQLDYDPVDFANDYYLPSATAGSGMVPIESYVTTAWFDAGSPEQTKDWVGAEMFFRTLPDVTCSITAASDWDPASPALSVVEDVGNSGTWDDGGSLPTSFTGNYPNFTAVPNAVAGAWKENSVLFPTLVDREGRDGEYDPVVPVSSERLAQPVRINRFCASRCVSVRVEPVEAGKWNLDRLTLFFERWLIRT